MLAAVERARDAGARVLAGGERLTGAEHDGGFYMAPTLVEDASLDSEIACTELFGPIATLHRVDGFEEAIDAANASPVRAHRRDLDGQRPPRRRSSSRGSRAAWRRSTGPTYGSEPHMPFGGVRRLGQRLARGRHGGARRLLRLEDRLRQPRPVAASSVPTRRRPDPGACGLRARPGQERARRSPAIR